MARIEPEEVATNLLRGHGLPLGPLSRVAGWTNEVWLGPTHVVRLSSGRFRKSFEHERRVIALLENKVRTPKVVAYGELDGREWLIMTRVPGSSLLNTWPKLSHEERVRVMTQLGEQLRALHDVDVPQDFLNPWLHDALSIPEKAADAYSIEPQDYRVITRGLEVAGYKGEPWLSEADEYLANQLHLFEGDRPTLIHGDVHFNNLMWDGGELAVLDFEGATTAAKDRELLTMIDFCSNPQQFFAPGQADVTNVEEADVQDALLQLRDVYPELFGGDHLVDRLLVYALMRQLLQINHFPPGSEYDPRPRLKALIQGEHYFPSWIN